MAFIGPVYPGENPPANSVDCTICTATRNISVSFTPATPAPANGYVIRYKKASETIWTTRPGGNVNSSPVTIFNVPACENINVSVQSSCGGGQTSSEVFAVAAGLGFPLKCGCTYQGTTEDLTFYQYASVPIDLTGVSNGSSVTLTYNAITRANKFDIYNETDLSVAATSNWVGDGGYSGPWSPGSPGLANGSVSFTYNSAKTYSLKVAVAGANPNNQTNDSWQVSLSCSTTPPPPTYYYYTGLLCGGGIMNSFRSTSSNLADSGVIVKALCSVCGNTEQCFDNISPTNTPNTNDVIATYADCAACAGGGSTPTVTGASAGFEPCVGGTVDDHLGGQITLSGPVATDTNFNIQVTYAPYPQTCSPGSNTTVNLSGIVLAGQSSGNVNACSSGIYVAGGGTVCSSIGTLI